jgi:potassium-transporting ATPase potassium-binding subunit
MNQEALFSFFQDAEMLLLLLGLGFLFGKAFFRIFKGRSVLGSFEKKVESFFFRMMGIDPEENMTAKKYILSALVFSLICFVFLFGLLLLQGFLFLNPTGAPNMSFTLAFNTAISFVTNTNWQAYSGETQASYLAQTLGFTVENFISGAVGIAALFALFRGFTQKESGGVGNFWADMTRIIVFMIPVCLLGALLLVSQGVPQTFGGSTTYFSLEGTSSTLYVGPVASQEIIKQLFTNGGGFYGGNSAYPFENPTPLSNLVESISILAIPIGLCFTFGEAIGDHRQANAL